jgi:hypothetical protein
MSQLLGARVPRGSAKLTRIAFVIDVAALRSERVSI